MDARDENPEWDAQQKTDGQPGTDPPPPIVAIPSRPISYWVKKFFACNPFYLVSAALLLYGLYLVSSDASFLSREISQLIFNFSSLQLYELLLVATAVVLARCRIWYDSVLLIGVENLLVLVPFILISQAALLNQRMVWIICVAGGVAALCRFWGLKRYFVELNLPRRALVCGLVLLVINVALPLVFRHLHDSKVGTKPTEGAAYEMNRHSWLLLLPAMFALFNLLPRPRQLGDLLPQRRWLPMGLFALWLIASAVHLYSLSYVYNFDWEHSFAFPLLWVLLWSVYLRHTDFLTLPKLATSLLTLPMLITLYALHSAGSGIFVALTIGNVVAYLLIVLKDRGNRAALHLLLLSTTALAAGLLNFYGPHVPGLTRVFSGEKALLLSAAGYLGYWVFRSRNPKVGLLGSLLMVIGLLTSFDNPYMGHLAVQFAMVFLLLHSLRWQDAEQPGAGGMRMLVCGIWVGHVWLLVHTGWMYALPLAYGGGALLMTGCSFMRLSGNGWGPRAVPMAAALVLLAQPGDFLAVRLQATPTPLLVVVGSFLLFGVGTLAALAKAKWNPPHAVVVPVSSQSKPKS